MRLLSVDWDYFFPDPFGGGMPLTPVLSEGKYYWQATLLKKWRLQLKCYIKAGDIPRTSRAENAFWGRFRFSPTCRLFVAETHDRAGDDRVKDGITEVWNFDAHHDCGGYDRFNDEARLTSGNCLLGYDNVEKHVRYPPWKRDVFDLEPIPAIDVDRAFDDEHAIEQAFDRIFVCRTEDMVAPWIDREFREFIEACPCPLEYRWPLMPRESIEAQLLADIAELGRAEC